MKNTTILPVLCLAVLLVGCSGSRPTATSTTTDTTTTDATTTSPDTATTAIDTAARITSTGSPSSDSIAR